MHTYKTVHGTTVHTDRKLTHCPNGQCGVRIDENGGIQLISYTTIVIDIDPHGWLVCHGTFSATTRKHIAAFCKEYANGLTYKSCKMAYEDNHTINIYTGEVVML